MNNEAENDEEVLVTDWRRLLTPSERAVLLDDIAQVSLAAGVRLLPDQPWSALGVAAGSEADLKSPIEQLGFIEVRLPTLAQAVQQIAQSPLTTAALRADAIPPQRARRVTAAAWMDHVRRGEAVRTVSETVSFLSHDTPENRAVKSFALALARDSRTIAQIAEADEEAEASARAAHCARFLDRMLGEVWWEEVCCRRADWKRHPTQRETLRPDYAHIARERSRYRRRFCFDGEEMTLPPRETWRLYETWCLRMVLRALHELGWTSAQPEEVLALRLGGLSFAPATGEQSRVMLHSAQGRTLSVTYNQTFAEGRESLSHAMQPDITLSDGERVWVLDAKFKPYAEPGEEGRDINQMHAYRDAIIGPEGTRTVAQAWCLYTGLAAGPNRPEITYGRSSETPVGALCLRPGDSATFTRLQRLLKRWLGSTPQKPAPQPFPET